MFYLFRLTDKYYIMKMLLAAFFTGLLHSLCFSMGSSANMGQGTAPARLSSKCDTVASFENIFTKLGLFPTILTSTACIEIRVYSSRLPITSGRIDIVKVYQDSSVHEKYTYDNLDFALSNPNALSPQEVINGKKEVAQKVARKLIPHTQATLQRLVEKLQMAGFFDMQDQSRLLDSLKREKVKVNSPCDGDTDCPSRALIFFEVKTFNSTRNFYMLQLDYATVNKSIKAFYQHRKIAEAFNEILLF